MTLIFILMAYAFGFVHGTIRRNRKASISCMKCGGKLSKNHHGSICDRCIAGSYGDVS